MVCSPVGLRIRPPHTPRGYRNTPAPAAGWVPLAHVWALPFSYEFKPNGCKETGAVIAAPRAPWRWQFTHPWMPPGASPGPAATAPPVLAVPQVLPAPRSPRRVPSAPRRSLRWGLRPAASTTARLLSWEKSQRRSGKEENKQKTPVKIKR